MTLTDTNNKVLITGHTSKKIKATRGLRQEEPLSMMFNTILEKAVRENEI